MRSLYEPHAGQLNYSKVACEEGLVDHTCRPEELLGSTGLQLDPDALAALNASMPDNRLQ